VRVISVNNLDDNIIDPLFNYKKYDPRELISDKSIDIGKKKLLKIMRELKDTRYSEEFFNDPAVVIGVETSTEK